MEKSFKKWTAWQTSQVRDININDTAKIESIAKAVNKTPKQVYNKIYYLSNYEYKRKPNGFVKSKEKAKARVNDTAKGAEAVLRSGRIKVTKNNVSVSGYKGITLTSKKLIITL